MSEKKIFGKARIRMARALLLLTLLVMLPGCASLDGMFSFFGLGDNEIRPDSPEAMVMDGMDDFQHARYDKALETFNEIKERFPFSAHSLLAELKSADCNYYKSSFPEAIVLYEEFLSNHPTNEAIPYVLFQVGMSYYRQIDTIDRDPGAAMDAITAFGRLLRTNPQSPYTTEAAARTQAARDFLANHEMYVAAFYVRTEEYVQAKSRLNYLLRTYPTSAPAPKAQELLAAIESGNPPKRTWRDWIPDIGLPDWRTFTSGLGPVPQASGPVD